MHAVVDCSCRRNIYMKHFSTIAPQLFYSYPIVEEEREQIDGILGLLEYSGVAEYLETVCYTFDFNKVLNRNSAELSKRKGHLKQAVPRRKLIAGQTNKAKEFRRKDAENVPGGDYKGTME